MRVAFLLGLLLPVLVSAASYTLNFDSLSGNADKSPIGTYEGVEFDKYALLSFPDDGQLFTIDPSSPSKSVNATFATPFFSLSFQVKATTATVSGYVSAYSAEGVELGRQSFQGTETLSPSILVNFENLASFAIFHSDDAENVNFDNIVIDGTPQPADHTCTDTCTSSNNGQCVNGYCNCFSGYSGKQCQVNPPGDFSPQTIDQAKAFHHSIHFVLEDKVTFTVSIPSIVSIGNRGNQHSYSTVTALSFEGNGDTKCDYPKNPNWVLKAIYDTDASQWVDTYTNIFSYKDLYDCGLRMSETLNGVTYFNNSLLIEKDSILSNGRMKFDRNIKVSQQFSFGFPTVIAIRKDVVVNPPRFLSTWLDLSFDITEQKWHIIVGAVVEWPFKLSLTNDPTQITFTPARGFVMKPVTISPECGVFDTIASCLQTYEFVADSCEIVKLENLELDFDLVCRSSEPLKCSNELPVVAKVALTTTSACPISKEVDIGKVTLKAYSSVVDSDGLPYFGYSQDAHFTIDFADPPLKLSDVSIADICAFPLSEKNNVVGTCPDKYKVDSADIKLEDKGAHKVAFYIRSKKMNDASGVTGFSNTLVVQADLLLTYSGNFNKRSTEYTRSGTLLLAIKDDGTDGNPKALLADPSSASKLSGILLSIFALLAILL
eukprot:TRINITY_DN707_c0_g1_i2.p1 TRINITY_DN707_c0_g1~~TRINITY_DN707_c0_g1_i2.p1  ORF type:complete len:659 (+),score=177.84 TRINITY_DN707_c0_g1_i2:147-2123(+)